MPGPRLPEVLEPGIYKNSVTSSSHTISTAADRSADREPASPPPKHIDT